MDSFMQYIVGIEMYKVAKGMVKPQEKKQKALMLQNAMEM